MRLTPKLSNKSVVTRNPAYAYRTVNGKTYLTSGSIQCHLNASASFVWEQLKQSITIGELVNTLAAQYHLSKKRAQKDLYLLIKTLFQAGLVYIDGKTCTEKVLDTSKPKMNFSELQMKMVKEVIKERTLIKLTLELTYSCSLHCRYCYASAVSGNIMTLEEIEDLLEQAADMGVLYLTLTGGEPLTRPDLIEIVKKAEDLGFWTRIQSGGGSFRKDIIEGLSCFRHVSFSVTLHGADATTHDSFTRVPGSFEKAIKGVQLLAQNGVPVTIKQVITKHNVNQTAKLADLAKDLGVSIQRSPLVYPTTMGDKDPLSLRLENEELVKLMEAGLYKPSPDPCGAGSSKLVISPLGEAFPCVFVRVNVGNMRHQSLKQIWHSPSLELIRKQGWFEQPPPICQSCKFVSYCPRCPAIAFLDDGDIRGKSREACRISRLFAKVGKCYE